MHRMRWLLLGALLLVGGFAALWNSGPRMAVQAQTIVTPIGTVGTNPFQPTYTFAPFVTTTPLALITIDPRIGPTTRPCPLPQSFALGSRVALTPGVNVRSAPSLSAALVNYYALETALTILGGPVCANGYNWWHVSGEAYSVFDAGEETRIGTGEPGWVIEGAAGRLFLINISVVDPSALCYAPLPLAVGRSATVLTGVRAHEQPSLGARVIEVAPLDAEVPVLAGPVCADGLNWWRIRVPLIGGGSVEAWVAEGYPGAYFLQPDPASLPPTAPFCFRSLRVGAGTRAAVLRLNNIPLSLRAEPGANAPLVASLLNGVAFDVTGPSVCADGFNWWPVRVVGGSSPTGWLAEGTPGNYWWDIISH